MTKYTITTSQPRVKKNSSEVKYWIFGMSAEEGGVVVIIDGKWIPENLDIRDFDYTPELIRYEYDKWATEEDVKSKLDTMLVSRKARFTLPLRDSIFIEGTEV